MCSIESPLRLREANRDDSELLFAWRNDCVTRKASHCSEAINKQEHDTWFNNSLSSKTRCIFIAELTGVAVGTVRYDLIHSEYILSWTVAPEHRGKRVAKKMLQLFAAQINEAICAQIKVGNLASVRVAESVGMKLEKEVNGVLYYRRPPLPASNN